MTFARSLRSARLELRLMVLSLRRSGSRTVLAWIAMTLGIAAMMILLALGAGARREFEAITDQLGRNQFTIKAGLMPASPAFPGIAGRARGRVASTRLSADDVALLRNELAGRGLKQVAPILERSSRVRLGREALTTSVRGVTPEFVALRNFHLEAGRLLDELDGAERRRVAVVGSFVVERLGGGGELVGETLWIAGVPFEVVGRLAAKGITGDAQNEDDQILVPLETARRRLWNVEYLSRLLVEVDSDGTLRRIRSASGEVLRRSHRLDEGVGDDFEVLDLVRANVIRQRGASLLTGLSGFFAALTLGLGGVGILSVTWLDVRERTPEIGLRRAIGARRRDIVRLFAGEACILAAAGGVCGLAIGGFAVAALRAALQWPMVVELAGTALSFAVAVLLGLTFGIVPALRAARIPPIDALRDA